VVSGSGSAFRQFMYSEDLARIIAYFINDHEPKERHESFICAPSEADEVSIGSVARKIARNMGYENNLEFDTTQPEGQHRKPASNQLLMKTIGDFKFSNFDEKLKDTMDWFKAQQI
jgi:GDP-L-fucose synthase